MRTNQILHLHCCLIIIYLKNSLLLHHRTSRFARLRTISFNKAIYERRIIIISNQHHISRNVNVSPFITILLKHFLPRELPSQLSLSLSHLFYCFVRFKLFYMIKFSFSISLCSICACGRK